MSPGQEKLSDSEGSTRVTLTRGCFPGEVVGKTTRSGTGKKPTTQAKVEPGGAGLWKWVDNSSKAGAVKSEDKSQLPETKAGKDFARDVAFLLR